MLLLGMERRLLSRRPRLLRCRPPNRPGFPLPRARSQAAPQAGCQLQVARLLQQLLPSSVEWEALRSAAAGALAKRLGKVGVAWSGAIPPFLPIRLPLAAPQDGCHCPSSALAPPQFRSVFHP